MTRRLALWVLPVMGLTALAGARIPAATVQAQQKPPPAPPSPRPTATSPCTSILKVTPREGHSGDLFYVSGNCLPANTRLQLMMGCPNWIQSARDQYGNAQFSGTAGPMTDANGSFVAYRWHALPLQHYKRSDCQLYAQYGNTSFGPDIPGSYRILARSDALAYWDTHIGGEITPSPKRIHSGLVEHITIRHSWPGATAEVTIHYAGQPAIHARQVLNWNGAGEIDRRVPGAGTGAAHVQVQFQLGHSTGSAFSDFQVIR